MNDERKTKAQLAEELADLRLQVADLRQRETRAAEAEKALHESERFLQAVFDGIQDGLAVRGRDYNILRVNRWIEQMFADQMPLVGKKCYATFEGRDAPCPDCPSVDAGKTGEIHSRVVSYTPAEGPQRRIEVTAFPLTDAAGEVVGAIDHVKDVTDQWRAEEDLRLAQASINAASDSIFWIAPDGRFMYVNDAACRTLGYTRDELLGKRVADVDPDYTHEKRAAQWERVKRGGVVTFESRHRTREGRVFPIEVTSNYLRFGDHEYEFAFSHDITDRKRAEEALRRSEEDYRLLFEQSVDGIVVVADGKIVRANQVFADIHGWSVEELIGMTSTDLLHPDERAAAAERIRGVIDRTLERSNARQYHALRADGSIALVEYRSRRILWNGRPAVQAIVRDITERVRLEEELRQAQKMEAVGQLAGGIAHDFNNLMTGILCHADLLKSESPSPEDVREAANLIEGAARRAAELTGQLLGFARRGKRRDVAVDLNATARTSVRLLGRSLDPRIRVTMPFRDEHAFVRGDPLQMEQVVLNLAMNARDAMPEGGEMTLTIQTLDVAAEDCKSRPGAEPGRYVVLGVQDSGCGIPEAMRGRVFEPFFTTKPHGKGTGMGLAMVYGIVKDHGGWVEVDSAPGRGTTFRVFLPAAKAPADTGATPADADLRAPPDAGRILVVDDEELVRNVVARMLSSLGYEVATAADAREAVEYYGRFGRDVSVVIIDMAMPEMDGRRCFAALRGLDPDVKALLATGWGNEDRVQDALDEGMAGLVRKPFQTKQLAKAVKQALTQ